MYPPPSFQIKNAGRICGHIMPLNYAYFRYGLLKAGFKNVKFFSDRLKKRYIFHDHFLSFFQTSE